MTIGRYLRICRIKADKTQSDIADLFGLSSSQLISNVERELCNPPKHMIVEWCDHVGADANKIRKQMIREYIAKLDNSLGIG